MIRKYIPKTEKEKELLQEAREKALELYSSQLTTPIREIEKYDFRRGFEYAVGWLIEHPQALKFFRSFLPANKA